MGCNIQEVSDALLCSNCGACKAACPKDAISFASTSLGRMAAKVGGACVNCGMCASVCPSLDRQGLRLEFADMFVGNILNVYTGKARDEAIFNNAQSGGVATAIIAYLLDAGAIDCAVLCRMKRGAPPKLESTLIKNKSELAECQKSCYTPVDLLSALRKTAGRSSVAIVGLPCHIEGAEQLLRKCKSFSNIRYKIGLICERTLCGAIQDVLLSYVRVKSAKIAWKNKSPQRGRGKYAYRNAPVTIAGDDGKEKVLPNLYRFALKEYFTSPRCRVCADKLNAFCDIALGDPWGMSGIDWQNGENVIIARTERAKRLLAEMQKAGRIELKPASQDELLAGQRIEERRAQVARYSKALNVLPFKADSWLYGQGDGVSSSDAESEEREIMDFMRRDSLPKENIVRECRARIARQRLGKMPIFRILRKIKRRLGL